MFPSSPEEDLVKEYEQNPAIIADQFKDLLSDDDELSNFIEQDPKSMLEGLKVLKNSGKTGYIELVNEMLCKPFFQGSYMRESVTDELCRDFGVFAQDFYAAYVDQKLGLEAPPPSCE